MRTFIVCVLGVCLFTSVASVKADIVNETLWINELHYDNSGADMGEAVEVVVPVGFDVSTLRLEFYNGSNGSLYDTDDGGAWVAGATVDGFTLYTSTPGSIQNGAPDGLGLSSIDGTTLYQFLSYEGALTAVGGNWDTRTSTDIGVSEGGGTAIGESLQLTGTGTQYSSFTWVAPSTDNFGAINTGQSFAVIPEPSTIGLLGLAIVGFGFARRRKTAL